MLVIEAPADTMFNSVAGGRLMSASAEAEASAAAQDRPAHSIALIQVDGALAHGAMLDVVVNVTAAEQARRSARRAARRVRRRPAHHQTWPSRAIIALH
jgi:DNA-binding protein H-NS